MLLSESSDKLTTAVSDSMEVWSEKDDEGDQASLLPTKFPYEASHEACKDVYSGPKSCAWKGRNGIRLEVVALQKNNMPKRHRAENWFFATYPSQRPTSSQRASGAARPRMRCRMVAGRPTHVIIEVGLCPLVHGPCILARVIET